jgi:hypothetical protein
MIVSTDSQVRLTGTVCRIGSVAGVRGEKSGWWTSEGLLLHDGPRGIGQAAFTLSPNFGSRAEGAIGQRPTRAWGSYGAYLFNNVHAFLSNASASRA